MLGAYAVGKTSLVRRCVDSLFSERYHTTVGVKVDKKQLRVHGQAVTLMLWDLEGEDDFHPLHFSHLRGASAYLLVADGTRASTLSKAASLQESAKGIVGPVPFVLALNKCDLKADWRIEQNQIEAIKAKGFDVMFTSARTGEGVDEMFESLTHRVLAETCNECH